MITYRTLTAADAEAYRDLRLAGLQAAPPAFASSYEEEAQQSVADVEAFLRRRLSPLNVVHGAFSEARLVGLVGVYLDTSKRKKAHKAHLWGMYVEPAFQRRGIARELVQRAVHSAHAMPGALRLELAVESTNAAAKALYAAMGFELWGTEPEALRIGDRYFDLDCMSLALRQKE